MRAFEVTFVSTTDSGLDTILANDIDEIKSVLIERGYGEDIEILICNELSLEEVRLKNITVGDFLRLLYDEVPTMMDEPHEITVEVRKPIDPGNGFGKALLDYYKRLARK